jgi:hypothetical protein
MSLRMKPGSSSFLGIVARAVLGEDGEWHQADLYRVVEPDGPFTPAKSYIALMLEGAEAHGLDPGYIEDLRRLYESLS